MTRREQVLRQKRRKRKRYSRTKPFIFRLAGVGVLCLFVVLFLSHAAMAGDTARLIVQANSVEILQDQWVSNFDVKVILDKEEHGNIVLDPDTGYTVYDLMRELYAGKHYTITCEADNTVEGVYPIVLELDPALEEKVRTEWAGKVEIVAEDSTMTVKNKQGEWDGDRFIGNDGTAMTSTFVDSGGNTYYFDENGNKVTGFQEIGNSSYYFGNEGSMHKGWLETDDGTFYFGEDGTMQTGWLELEGEKYYLDEEGRMLTGEHRIGMKMCVFAKDGRLKSAEHSVDPEKPMIALTFDDGPGERTMELLNVLEQYDAHATFFMLGENVGKYEDEIRKMVEIGCELGNHSYDHSNLTELDAKEIKEQMSKTNKLIKKADGEHTATVMRPPYGSINDTVEKNVGMPMIAWSVDTMDWKSTNKQKTLNTILNTAEDGDIVLLHDIHSSSVDVAIDAIPQLIADGYQLVTVSEMAEARGKDLKDGVSYSHFYP